MSLALAIIGDIVPPRERARYQGYFLAVFGSASVIGPLAGSAFAGAHSILGIAGWRWVFLVNVPIAGAALIVVAKVLNLPHTRREARIDWLGALMLTIGVVPVLLVAEQGQRWGWLSAQRCCVTCSPRPACWGSPWSRAGSVRTRCCRCDCSVTACSA